MELTAPDIGLAPHRQIDNPDLSRKINRVSNPQCLLGGECCATATLTAQDDFRSTRFRFQGIVEDTGHIFLLYPKFHCELNWIGCGCNYTLAGELRLGVRIRGGTEC